MDEQITLLTAALLGIIGSEITKRFGDLPWPTQIKQGLYKVIMLALGGLIPAALAYLLTGQVDAVITAAGASYLYHQVDKATHD
jgi:VIT1/CCC1 family predicted Fe2+/Mn2+ transporter